MATDNMKPAPNASKCSITLSWRAARRVTASAPSTLPAAAARAYSRALDTREQILAGIAGWILQHVIKQALQGFANLWTGTHTRLDKLVAFNREILEGERVIAKLYHRNRRLQFRVMPDSE